MHKNTVRHPVLAIEGRIALTLRILGGLTTAEIARAFLVPEKTMGQRITRAKKALTDANVPFETPRGKGLQQRSNRSCSSSTLSSTRVTPRRPVKSGSAPRWSKKHFVSRACSLS
jgi:hypothetical protein